MGYGGESNAKKLARLSFWEYAFNRFTDVDWPKLSALVLCGPEGADLRVIKNMGWGECVMENMVAIDVDPRSLEVSEQQNPGPRYMEGRIEELCRNKKLRRKFDIVFLDYCGTITDQMLDHFSRVVSFVARDNAFVALGCMYGRERKDIYRRIASYEPLLIDEDTQLKNAEIAKEFNFVTSRMSRSERVRAARSIRAATLRALFLEDEVCKRLRSRGMVYLDPYMSIYRSGRKNGAGKNVGVPMLYMGWRIRRVSCSGRVTRRKWTKECLKLAVDQSEKEERFGLNRSKRKFIGDDADGKHLEAAVGMLVRLGYSEESVSEQLNMSEEEVALYSLRVNRATAKALLKHGTYAEADVETYELDSATVYEDGHYSMTARHVPKIEFLTPYQYGLPSAPQTTYDAVECVKRDISRAARVVGSARAAEVLGAKRQQIAAWVAWDTTNERVAKEIREKIWARDKEMVAWAEKIRSLEAGGMVKEARALLKELRNKVRKELRESKAA